MAEDKFIADMLEASEMDKAHAEVIGIKTSAFLEKHCEPTYSAARTELIDLMKDMARQGWNMACDSISKAAASMQQ